LRGDVKNGFLDLRTAERNERIEWEREERERSDTEQCAVKQRSSAISDPHFSLRTDRTRTQTTQQIIKSKKMRIKLFCIFCPPDKLRDGGRRERVQV